jgi:D-alanine-D-alanine ligase
VDSLLQLGRYFVQYLRYFVKKIRMPSPAKKKKIAIAAGGDSGESVISLNSARVIRQNLDARHYDAYVIFINRHKWVYMPDKGKEVPVDRNDFSIKVKGKKITFDCVFNAIHGTPGENGRLQGYLDLIGMPYTTCNLVTSALTFNKSYCNKVVAQLGIRTSRSLHLFRNRPLSPAKILKELKLPVFVKPNNGGSSIGMSKVNYAKDLPAALTKAFKEDNEILVEEFVKGTEITCGVFNYKGKLLVMPITEIVPEKEFFDYEAKYLGKSKEITPARISEEMEIQCKTTSAFLYDKLNCKGVVRFDYIMTKDDLNFLEVNTVPGMSEASIIPQQAKEFGFTITEFFSMMIEDTLFRNKNRK